MVYLKQLALAALILMSGVTNAFAVNAWCAQVKHGIPDDFLNVRTGPGIEYQIIDKIYPGDAVAVSTARCGLDNFEKTLCAGQSSDWRFLELKLSPSLELSAGAVYHGWVNSIYLVEAPCRD